MLAFTTVQKKLIASLVTNVPRRANYALSGFSRTSLAIRLELFDLKANN
jgi:hypothetical protein